MSTPDANAVLVNGSAEAGAAPTPIFTSAELEQIAMRRFNPYTRLTGDSLSRALDSFAAGDLRWAAILWAEICRRDTTISTIKAKREEAVALRDWTTITMDESPAAADQAAALRAFYQGLRARHAVDRNTVGGFPLLVTQMLDSVAMKYAVHHLMWHPNAAAKFKLPSGRTVPALTLEAEMVPLEYFEARTGELRFLGIGQGYNGQPLAPNDWLVTVGPALMIAACIGHYFKRLAQHDLINFSEKFGTPGLVVHTTASKDSPEGIAAQDMARSLAGNYRGVQFNAAENKVEIVWPSGGTAGSNLPMTTIIEDTKRELTALWLGEDLSTMSRSGTQKSIGASVQGDEREKRERADCARISETLNAQIDPVVIRWFFGDGAPILARVVLESPINEDRALLGDLTQMMVTMGAPVSLRDTARRLQVSLAKDGEPALVKPVAPVAPTPVTGMATNAALAAAPDAFGIGGKLQRAAALRFAKAKLGDMEAITGRLADIETIDNPVIKKAALNKYVADLPGLLAQVNLDPAVAKVIADSMSAAIANGFVEGAISTHGSAETTTAPQTP